MYQEQIRNKLDKTSVIIFEIGLEEFAIELSTIKEIVRSGQIRKLPKSLDFIDGIYNYRGEIIHILNLEKVLNLHENYLYKSKLALSKVKTKRKKKYIIILDIAGVFIGFFADQIVSIAHVNAENIVGLSPIFQTSVGMENIKGIIKFKDRPRILLDLSNLLNEIDYISIKKEEIKMQKKRVD